ncbi:inorganic phosphate transporter [Rhodomicrobium sp. Az07]|uniref:inorganic phosphate transporter n=1 Tax=Rhodomicrobium sp. Az07 TaxID=2839034 RepID=UPI001BE62774|nr:inorganic phosphate transporter [Rhodomicrobium sp. Az07]MBT3070952.1 inorganic phosphate transporter [Rhodomicrobium sp. Az07]
MSDIAVPLPQTEPQKAGSPKPDLDVNSGPGAGIIFSLLLAGGLLYTAFSIYSDVENAGVQVETYLPFMLLGVALLIALGFEFVNGFHDTANAVATVIYTHSLPAQFAVVWSGFFNFLGVLFSSGAVAFGIVSLLPVELILQVGSEAGFAMVFALLIAAIIWNLSTWYFGLPSSSSHTLIGSIIGVGVANAILHGQDGTSGVDWSKATEIGYALLLSPVVGFVAAGLLLLSAKAMIRNPALYQEPKGKEPPPVWIRGLLILTCTGVSFAHGSNDGQKGMGLIMLILIGTVPTAYALNKAPSPDLAQEFIQTSRHVAAIISEKTQNRQIGGDPRPLISTAISLHQIDQNTLPAVGELITLIANQVQEYGSVAAVPGTAVANVRNDMYLASEALRFVLKDKSLALTAEQTRLLQEYKSLVDEATRFIPLWVKISVAIALGLGTMIGWKRIVVTVGEKIGKQHLTYAQGASAEIVAMATIFAADRYGLPVSTTHVLSSGVAGTMAANRSGLQWSTIRNLLMAWVLTLPMSILLAASLFWAFVSIF